MTFDRTRLPDPVSYFQNIGNKLIGHGKHFRTVCTLHDGDSPDSLSVLRDSGAFNCFACGASGGNVLDHHMQVTGDDFVTSAKALGAWVDDGKPSSTYKPAPIPARDALTILGLESLLIAIEGARMAKGITPDEATKDRLLIAAGRINQIRELFQ